MRITKKKVIAGTLVGGVLLAVLPAVAEAKGRGGRGGGGAAAAVFAEAGDAGPASSAPPGYLLWHIKLSGSSFAKKHYLEAMGWDVDPATLAKNPNTKPILDIQVRRKHSENFYFNPYKVKTVELLYDGQPVSFTPDGQTVTQAPNTDDYCFAKAGGGLREVVTGVGCNAR